MPPLSSNLVINYLGTSFSDPSFDRLLAQFSNDHPAELETWRNVERRLFETRPGLDERVVYMGGNVEGNPVELRPGVRPWGYPDQQLKKFIIDYLSPRLPDLVGELGAHHAWQMLRGRVLRSLLDEEPRLNPASDKVLITWPRTCSDEELASVVAAFMRDQPATWSEWQRIARQDEHEEDTPLRHVGVAFNRFVRTHCWAQSSTALGSAFGDAHKLFFCAAGEA